MKRLTFKEYYDNKAILKKAGIENVRTFIEYSVSKYCKIPVIESYLDAERNYISLKPKDTIKILWEYEGDIPVLKRFVIVSEDDKEYIPCWTSQKMYEWTGTNCKKNKAIV